MTQALLSSGQHDLQEPRHWNQTNYLKTETEVQEVHLFPRILLSHKTAQNNASGHSMDGPRDWDFVRDKNNIR